MEHLTKVYENDVKSLVNPMVHKGTLPLDCKLLVMGVDVGQNASHWVVTAIRDNDSLQVVDWGTIASYKTEQGNEGVAALFDKLLYRDPAGNELRPDLCLIDAGYDTQDVYLECRRASYPGTIIPVKGSSGKLGAWAKSAIRTMPDAGFSLILFSDFQLKKALYLNAVKGKQLVLPNEADNPLIQGLSGQEMKKTSGGKAYWKEVTSDHFGDAVKYSILANWMRTSEATEEEQKEDELPLEQPS